MEREPIFDTPVAGVALRPGPDPAVGTPLPQGRVLSYVGHVNTPTRIRHISARVLRIVGTLQVVAAVVMLAFLTLEVHQYAVDMARGRARRWPGPVLVPGAVPVAPTPIADDYRWGFQRVMTNYLQYLLAASVALPCGLLLVLMAGAVRKGQRLGSQLCLAALFPLMAAVGIAAAVAGCFAVMYTFGLFRERVSLVALPYYLAVAVMTLVLMLLVDVCGFLGWIMRNPGTEKPPMPFLPRGEGRGTGGAGIVVQENRA